ncbi:flagellar basal body rod protein FlgC [Marichromatium gracile]|uniref:Flagellar basal-body rod protein FlgC n=1 Tax=Marichromatium gracile TaxID=1048 RepID=A0A4R4AA46_MARGR|nr:MULTISPECIES: flagellar basal body rod protein FlgC [Marichromatium]MBO8087135.1 flagellar basal body rod protein FlgC [Marichromatium sp.]MBK1708147.1 flagellar basal body rod protein FlgC [Marichromatium gracile]MCF1182938.1 flagellar basal body rod protein FlgC [Marichromatium gracile]RNE89617.1 flagellar basal body rod protein FlgC [Marichromatium sp. AB31]RNE94696.1 flagellar basal body rod protein FlgC [Marichromatium sp. AB32]
MSTLFSVFNTSASALTAQSVRLNTVASNLANANTAASSPEETYKSKQVLFQTLLDRSDPTGAARPVRVADIVDSTAEPIPTFEPNHPQANEEGYVFRPAISVVEEMANMMSASRSYEANVEVMNTSRQLLQRTLRIGQS